MSTLSGIAQKGEKGKGKFQSLDINNLYRASRGESLETHQHKNTSSRRHGMQSLGKVPSARRPPANLPSIKSEYSGNDPAINLVPSGGTGWGSKPGETEPPPSTTSAPVSTTPTQPSQSTAAAATSAPVSVSAPVPAVPASSPPTQSHVDKSWSSITSSGTENSPMFLAHQSPYFQQQFPSLSGDAQGGAAGAKSDAHFQGPSLRPQKEGSWMQGGSRPPGPMGAAAGSQPGTVHVQGPPLHLPQGLDVAGGRNNLGPSGAAGGPVGPLPPPSHHRLMPNFMIRHGHPSAGLPPNYQHGSRPRFPYPPDHRLVPSNRPPNVVPEELTARPIIKEEDLKNMDEIARDSGWATHDEIDYNQTLSFSDEESMQQEEEAKLRSFRQSVQNNKEEISSKLSDKIPEEGEFTEGEGKHRETASEHLVVSAPHHDNREPTRAWQQQRPVDFRHPAAPMGAQPHPPQPHPTQPHPNQPHPNQPHPAQPHPPRPGNNNQIGRQEEDEIWRERRRLQSKELENAVERARQRKEEEEKRYEETRQAATRKLKMLEEKMASKTGTDVNKEESVTSSPSPQQGLNSLLPDWGKDKEKARSRSNSGEERDDRFPKENQDHLKSAQVDSRGVLREKERVPEKEGSRAGYYQSNLPPRFQKQVAERSPPYYNQASSASQPSDSHPPFDSRWSTGNAAPNFGGLSSAKTQPQNDSEVSEREKEEIKNSRDRERSTIEAGFDSHEQHRLDNSCQQPEETDNYRFCDDARQGVKKSIDVTQIQLNQEDFDERGNVLGSKYVERRETGQKIELRDRPERPLSRDSRASHESRNSRESIREERFTEDNSGPEPMPTWTESSSYNVDQRDMRKKDSRNDLHLMHFHQRHIPPPITREKLEAAEQKNESSRSTNLVPLVRSDKKIERKKSDNQWEIGGSGGGDPWGRAALQTASPSLALATPTNSQTWVDLSAKPAITTDVDPGLPSESHHTKVDSEENTIVNKNFNHEQNELDSNRIDLQRGKMSSRGANRGMNRGHDRTRTGFPSYYNRGIHSYRGGQGSRRPPHYKMHEHSSAEGSADEKSASTESGKEDKRHDHDHRSFPRSPKQVTRRSDRDERQREGMRRFDGSKESYPPVKVDRRGMNMGSFEPRGEPSRRGRGGAPFRSKGSGTMSRRMDGYGPPNSKRPFTSESATNAHQRDNTKVESSLQNVSKEKTMGELSHDERMKLNQQQLAAGLIGNSRLGHFNSDPVAVSNVRSRGRNDGEKRERKPRDGQSRKMQEGKSGSGSGGEVGDEAWETTSETSDPDDRNHEDASKRNLSHNMGPNQFPRPNSRRHSQSNRNVGRDKRRGGSYDRDRENHLRRPGGPPVGQGSVNGSGRLPNKSGGAGKEQFDQAGERKQPRPDKEKRNNLDRIDLSNTASVVVIDDQPEGTAGEDQRVLSADGFKEVRNKKNVKEANRQKEESQRGSKERVKPSKPPSSNSPGPNPSASGNKGSYERERDRSRPGKLPPRLAKLRETNRMQQKLAQHHQTLDISEVNKINQGNAPLYPAKDGTCPAPPPAVNAWDKPITAALRTSTPPASVASPSLTADPATSSEQCIVEVKDRARSTTSSQRSSPSEEKTTGNPKEQAEKAVLDGSSPPVQTIIFENTNFKASPLEVAVKAKYTGQAYKNQRPAEKPKDRKLKEDNVLLEYKSPGPEIKLQDCKTDQIQMPISFNKNEDAVDMKLDFNSFNSSIAHLTDDKTNKGIPVIHMSRSIQMVTQSSVADLQFKLASTKKVWDNSTGVLEHGEDSSASSAATSFTPTFTNSLEDTTTYGKPDQSGVDDTSVITSEAVYNSSQQLQSSANTYNGNTVQALIKPDSSSNVCKVKPQPQSAMHPHSGPLSPSSAPLSAQYSQHLSYQPQAQFSGVSAIPSPPTVFTPQPELYQTFQLNNPQVPQVLGNQGRSQFSQFASPYLSQTLGQTSGFSQQSLYLHQTAPPPTAAPPVPDMFQTQLSQYRIQPPAPYGTTQQLGNNPNTVLISSSTNSLMSASVKPSQQPIGAIGSKGASYQTTSQPPPSQLYIYPDPQLTLQTQYMPNSQLVQRQASNVVPTIPHSSASYYSASSGGGAPGGYYQHGSSNVSLQAQGLHQNAFSMQAFNTQSPAGTPAGMGSFGSTMAQQYRSSVPQYLKSTADHQVQDVLSVFSSPAPQIDSSKSRGGSDGGGGGGKPRGPNGPPTAAQQQHCPGPQSHEFAPYHQNVSSAAQLVIQQQQQRQQQRGGLNYPAPIQRPASFQPSRHTRPPTRYKMAALAATPHTLYYAQGVPAKLNNAEIEQKVDIVTSECDKSTSASSPMTAELSEANSSSSNE